MMYTPARKTLGETIRRWREARGISQAEVARLMGYGTSQFISNWERGVSYPPISAAGKLAGVLKISHRTLVYMVFRCKQSDLVHEQKEVLKKLKAGKLS
jgi:transcriptional regulator with XRE-family HTH domain